MATTPASNLAFAELAPHSIQLVVLDGKKVVAARAFSLDAKADLAAFVAEHKLSGISRAAVIGAKNFLHRSGEAESGAVRQPGALQAHASKLPHGFDGVPVVVAVDAASGAAPDATRVTPWVVAAADAASVATARSTLEGLGLSPADVTVAAPAHLGVVCGSLTAGETAVILIPGEDGAHLAWVGNDGVQAVAGATLGYSKIYEAVQQGLGLKFKAAAGKLFYNESYDFSDAAAKIASVLAEDLKAALNGRSATYLHIAGLVPAQAWLVNHLAKAIGLRAWMPAGASLPGRLGLELDPGLVSAGSAGLLKLSSAGTGNGPWVQSTLEALAAARPRTAVPFPAAAPSAPAPASPQPAPRPAPAAVESVSVQPRAAAQAPAAPARKGNKGPVLIAATVGVVAAVVGLAAYFRSPPKLPSEREAAPAPAATPAPAPEAPKPAPAPGPIATTPVPAPAPVAIPSATSGASADRLAADARRFANDRYKFEVTEKGFIQALSTTRDEVLVESAAGISLQGSYVGTDGRRKWFNVGGVDDIGYQATVKKSVQGGATVFDVKVTHPRFELEQTFTCLADTVKVSAKFTPINLRDPRGVIAAVHSVRLSPVALNPSLRMRATSDAFAYAMKAGTLRVGFDSSVWARDGADGRQTIIAGENGVAFHFTENTDAARNSLNFEIALP